MSTRYVIVEESISGHCCFSYSIIDSTKSNKQAICETFTRVDAELICNALNKMDKSI